MLELGNLRFDDDGAAEMDGKRRIVFVPRADIVSVEAAYGSGSERPLVVTVLGVLLLLIAITPVVMLVNAYRIGGTVEVKMVTGRPYRARRSSRSSPTCGRTSAMREVLPGTTDN